MTFAAEYCIITDSMIPAYAAETVDMLHHTGPVRHFGGTRMKRPVMWALIITLILSLFLTSCSVGDNIQESPSATISTAVPTPSATAPAKPDPTPTPVPTPSPSPTASPEPSPSPSPALPPAETAACSFIESYLRAGFEENYVVDSIEPVSITEIASDGNERTFAAEFTLHYILRAQTPSDLPKMRGIFDEAGIGKWFSLTDAVEDIKKAHPDITEATAEYAAGELDALVTELIPYFNMVQTMHLSFRISVTEKNGSFAAHDLMYGSEYDGYSDPDSILPPSSETLYNEGREYFKQLIGKA